MKRFVIFFIVIVVVSIGGYYHFFTEDDKPYNPLHQSVESVVDGHVVDKWSRVYSLVPARYYLIYFSAQWCAPCLRFTPLLDQFYRDNRKDNNFEVLFVSSDRSVGEMFEYMQKMPWPAIDQESLSHTVLSDAYGGPGIPNLVVVKADGEVVFSSYVDGEYIGPAFVLEQFEAVLSVGSSLATPIKQAVDVVGAVNDKKKDVLSQGEKSAGDVSVMATNESASARDADVKPGEYVLSAIFVSELKRGALINGSVFYEGDTIDGVVVQNVGKESVILTKDGVDIIIDITR